MTELPPHLHAGLTDSAGQPWSGRTFQENPWRDDDGRAPDELIAALAGFHAGEHGPAPVIDALAHARLLVPLVAAPGDSGVTDEGRLVDKSAELSIVTVSAADGRGVVPVFSSAASMQRWNPRARPIPIEAQRAALGALDDGVELLVLDPGSDTEFLVRRPAVMALAQGAAFTEPWRAEVVVEAARAVLDADTRVLGLDLLPGDPSGRGAGPDLVIALRIDATTPETERSRILEDARALLATRPDLAAHVDALALRLELLDAAPAQSPRGGRRSWFARRKDTRP